MSLHCQYIILEPKARIGLAFPLYESGVLPLNYFGGKFSGAVNQICTDDLDITNIVLCYLSYNGLCAHSIIQKPEFVKNWNLCILAELFTSGVERELNRQNEKFVSLLSI